MKRAQQGRLWAMSLALLGCGAVDLAALAEADAAPRETRKNPGSIPSDALGRELRGMEVLVAGHGAAQPAPVIKSDPAAPSAVTGVYGAGLWKDTSRDPMGIRMRIPIPPVEVSSGFAAEMATPPNREERSKNRQAAEGEKREKPQPRSASAPTREGNASATRLATERNRREEAPREVAAGPSRVTRDRETKPEKPKFTVETGGDAPRIYASDGTYLGKLSKDKHDPESISNPHGKYGSRYGDSLRNPYSPYGNRYSSTSANNPYADDAPRIYAPDGTYLGKLSVNKYDPESISNPYGKYGSRYGDTLNNPYSRYGRYWPSSNEVNPSKATKPAEPGHVYRSPITPASPAVNRFDGFSEKRKPQPKAEPYRSPSFSTPAPKANPFDPSSETRNPKPAQSSFGSFHQERKPEPKADPYRTRSYGTPAPTVKPGAEPTEDPIVRSYQRQLEPKPEPHRSRTFGTPAPTENRFNKKEEKPDPFRFGVPKPSENPFDPFYKKKEQKPESKPDPFRFGVPYR
jgi:hypothetical protein